MGNIGTIALAFAGGLIPALLWLWFWLREDRCQPEPRRLILYAFLGGMIAVPLVLPFQKAAAGMASGTALIFLWAAIEEVMKLIIAYVVVLRRRELDEPVDALIYLISIAVGFAALENALFLLEPLSRSDTFGSVIAGNLRFIGATLLHILSSATIGLGIAAAFYRSPLRKLITFTGAVILAILLHTFFNLFIIVSNGGKLFTVFIFVWIGVVILLLLFEKVKKRRDYC